MNLRHLHASQAASLLTRPHQHGDLTRRQFLKSGATAAALAVGAGLGYPQAAWADVSTAWSTANGSACHGSWMLCGGSTGSAAASKPQATASVAATTSAMSVRKVTGQGCIIDRWRRHS